MAITRYAILHRKFIRLVNAAPDAINPAEVTSLIEETDRYFSAPFESALEGELTPFDARRRIRSRAQRLVERSQGLAWHPAIADLVARLPHEETLANGTRFTSDFVTMFQRDWHRALQHLGGEPDLHGLEVGSFEGRSCIWFLDTILTHPTSRITCVDSFDFGGQGENISANAATREGLQDRFDRNLVAAGHSERVIKRPGRSQEELRKLPLGRYGFAYIDGSHLTCDVLEDVVLAWRLLRQGGILLLDDYAYARNNYADPTANPGAAIDAFASCFAGQWTELHRGYQLILRKDVT